MDNSFITISYDEKARDDIKKQLSGLMGDKIGIESLCLNELNQGFKFKNRLILITASAIQKHALPFIGKNCTLIIAKRTLNLEMLTDLFAIPEGSNVLLVNNLIVNAQEVIQELDTLGINHVKFFPYAPNSNLDMSFKYAVTPGEPELVPKEIPNVINLGTRIIDIMTIAEILNYFNLDSAYLRVVSMRYVRNIVKLSAELSQKNRINLALRKQLEAILSNFDDGVIMFSSQKEVIFINTSAKNILSIQHQANIMQNIPDEILRSVSQLQNNDLPEYSFIQINNITFNLQYKKIPEGILVTLKNIEDIHKTEQLYRRKEKYAGLSAKYYFSDIVSKSPIMKDVIRKAIKVARTDFSILLSGETGTGKELLAQAIHNESPRRENPFVALNCASITESLLESELFGYEDGAFTGAKRGGKIGLFELADKGTLFLDEIGDAPLAIQTKLLRVIQEKEIMKVSGTRFIPVDVRIISATNKDLYELVEKGLFRKDLYYRLCSLRIDLPPLRERINDVPFLLRYFLKKYSRNLNFEIQMPDEAYNILLEYDWPGNIRELESTAQYIVSIFEPQLDLLKELKNLLFSKAKKHDIAVPIGRDISLEELCIILKGIDTYTAEGRFIGRKKLTELLSKSNVSLTENQLRNRLKILKSKDLIITKNGAGTCITKKGKKYLFDNLDVN